MTTLGRLTGLSLFAAVALVACSGDKGDDTADEYREPVANAGPDQAVLVGDDVTLDGSGSTVAPDFELSYTWTFRQVPVDSEVDDDDFGSSTVEMGSSPVGSSENPDSVPEFGIDGKKTKRRGEITSSSHIQGEQFSFSLESI